jgi:hypothetical protein
MGYTTEFRGRFTTDKEMSPQLAKSILDFSEERHHGGNVNAHEGFPGFWCNWAPSSDRMGIEWNGAEKFYDYDAWLQLIMDRFLKPAGITLSGSVQYRGEDFHDVGVLEITSEGKAVRKPFIYG